MQCFAHDGHEVHDSRGVGAVTAAERQHAAHEVRGVDGGLFRIGKMLGNTWRRLFARQLHIGQDDREHVVEIVRHAASHVAHGFTTLAASERIGHLLLVRDIENHARVQHTGRGLLGHAEGAHPALIAANMPEGNHLLEVGTRSPRTFDGMPHAQQRVLVEEREEQVGVAAHLCRIEAGDLLDASGRVREQPHHLARGIQELVDHPRHPVEYTLDLRPARLEGEAGFAFRRNVGEGGQHACHAALPSLLHGIGAHIEPGQFTGRTVHPQNRLRRLSRTPRDFRRNAVGAHIAAVVTHEPPRGFHGMGPFHLRQGQPQYTLRRQIGLADGAIHTVEDQPLRHGAERRSVDGLMRSQGPLGDAHIAEGNDHLGDLATLVLVGDGAHHDPHPIRRIPAAHPQDHAGYRFAGSQGVRTGMSIFRHGMPCAIHHIPPLVHGGAGGDFVGREAEHRRSLRIGVSDAKVSILHHHPHVEHAQGGVRIERGIGHSGVGRRRG